MHPRSAVAAVLVFTMAMEVPVAARADESAAPAREVMTVVVPVLPRIGAPLAPIGASATRSLGLFAPIPEEIRLSRGAKTAIIITAIVVGVLVIVGAVVISKPGRP